MSKNPFATNYVAPGKLDWNGEGESSLDEIAKRFLQFPDHACILGPHGSGKSTLLEHLVPRLGQIRLRVEPDGSSVLNKNGNVVWLRLRSRASSRLRSSKEYWKAGDLLIVDGWEQLDWWTRFQVPAAARKMGLRMLVTLHKQRWPDRFPVLHRSEVCTEQAWQIVQGLAPEFAREHLDREQVSSLLRIHNGNFREALMDLYDQFRGRNG